MGRSFLRVYRNIGLRPVLVDPVSVLVTSTYAGATRLAAQVLTTPLFDRCNLQPIRFNIAAVLEVFGVEVVIKG
jgi:hypothetical protein